MSSESSKEKPPIEVEILDKRRTIVTTYSVEPSDILQAPLADGRSTLLAFGEYGDVPAIFIIRPGSRRVSGLSLEGIVIDSGGYEMQPNKSISFRLAPKSIVEVHANENIVPGHPMRWCYEPPPNSTICFRTTPSSRS